VVLGGSGRGRSAGSGGAELLGDAWLCGHRLGFREVDERRLLCGASARCTRDGSGQL